MGSQKHARPAAFLLLLNCALLLASAQNTPHQTPDTKSKKNNAELTALSQQILDLATSVPPELAAYAQLRVVEAHGVTQQDQVIQLIESSYRLAGQSPYPVRMTSGGGGDARAGYLAAALGQNLDTLSLQTEAVLAMLKLDPERARDLFQQMRPLRLVPRTCSDSLLYAPSAYYRAAGAIYSRGFSQEEQAKGLPADFLESVFREVSQASQVVPAMTQLYEQHLDPDQQARMEAAFSRAISNVRGDSRSFTATQSMLSVLATRIARNAGLSHRALLEGTRTYLVANASGPQCQSGSSIGPPLSATSSDPYPDLNRIFQQYGIKPITPDEVKPASIISTNQNQQPPYWSSATAKQLRADESALRSGDKTSMQWQEQAEAFLTELRGWIDPSTEPSPDDFYIEKAVLFSDLVATAPVDSAAYNEALRDYMSFLSDQPESDYVRIFQLWSMRELVQRGRRDRSSAAQGRQQLEAAAHAAPNPSIALFGYLLMLEDTQHTEH